MLHDPPADQDRCPAQSILIWDRVTLVYMFRSAQKTSDESRSIPGVWFHGVTALNAWQEEGADHTNTWLCAGQWENLEYSNTRT
jgi:hypothetical protein